MRKWKEWNCCDSLSRFYNSNGNLGDWPISEDSRQRVTVVYRMKILRTKKSTLYDVRAQRTFDWKSPRNLMRMIPRYRRQLEGAVSRNKVPLWSIFFYSAIINRTWTAPRGATRWSRKFCRLLWRICPRCSTKLLTSFLRTFSYETQKVLEKL